MTVWQVEIVIFANLVDAGHPSADLDNVTMHIWNEIATLERAEGI